MSGVANGPLLAPEQASKLLDEVVYERVLGLLDLAGLCAFEQELWAAFHECGIEGDHVPELAKQMIDRALIRALDDPYRYSRFAPVDGVECSLCDEERELAAKQRKLS